MMYRIVSTRLLAQYNFGFPSILHGLEALLFELYGDNFTLVNIQRGTLVPFAVSDMKSKTISYNFKPERFFLEFLKQKFLGMISTNTCGEITETIRNSDIVIDLYGICFCDNLPPHYQSRVLLLGYDLRRFALSWVARGFGIKSVKNTASFGPMISKSNQRRARRACNYLFDVVSAREEASRQSLIQDGGVRDKDILLSPDIANLMPYTPPPSDRPSRIGVSTSHQIIRQWKSKESYTECIVALCRHISRSLNLPVVLIPNECDPKQPYNDVHVSMEIQAALADEGIAVEVLDVEKMTSSEIKNEIAACDVMVASRYHSCVASLSTGVPLLVIGWHYKYAELLQWYEQDEWMISQDNCSSELLINSFDRLWLNKKQLRDQIKARYPIVRQAVIDTGKILFSIERAPCDSK